MASIKVKQAFGAFGHEYSAGDTIPGSHIQAWPPGTLSRRKENGFVDYDEQSVIADATDAETDIKAKLRAATKAAAGESDGEEDGEGESGEGDDTELVDDDGDAETPPVRRRRRR
jgi:hypothetical protein